MRRNIGLYRGKEMVGDAWCEGSLAYFGPQNTPRIGIIDHTGKKQWHEVDPATVGECSGMEDKHGEPIFEWDVLGHREIKGVVTYDPVKAAFMFRWRMFGNKADETFKACKLSDYGFLKSLEVIGNINDNPELLQ